MKTQRENEKICKILPLVEKIYNTVDDKMEMSLQYNDDSESVVACAYGQKFMLNILFDSVFCSVQDIVGQIYKGLIGKV